MVYETKRLAVEAVEFCGEKLTGDLPDWLHQAFLNGTLSYRYVGRELHLACYDGERVEVAVVPSGIIALIDGQVRVMPPDLFSSIFELAEEARP